RHQDGVMATCQLDVVCLAAWALTKLAEFKSDDIIRAARGADASMLDGDGSVGRARLAGDRGEHGLEPRSGVIAVRPGRSCSMRRLKKPKSRGWSMSRCRRSSSWSRMRCWAGSRV
ncbi:MAG TPA: hypothetical protein VIH25_11040, partial [Steroidobacteraceae bacterium]